MKLLSLKLDEGIFEETEEITAKLKLARNRYINEALRAYNMLYKRRFLKKQLAEESRLTAADSMEVLHELEQLIDDQD